MNLELIKKEFDNYVNLFDMNNYNIKHKYNHSYRVMELSKKLSSSLNLNEEDVLLATVIGLLHDIGRFKQLELYNSYSDLNIDHADLGVKILFEDCLIEKFSIDREYYDIIKFSIKNHNKFEIENTSDDRYVLFSKIIRDADKLDIFETHIVRKEYVLPECSDDISLDVKKSFDSKRSVKYTDLKNKNDRIILELALIYDLNYVYSFNYIRDKKIIEILYDSIKNKDIFSYYFDSIIKYTKEKTFRRIT